VFVASAIAESDLWENGVSSDASGHGPFCHTLRLYLLPGLMLFGSFGEIVTAILRTAIANLGFIGGLTGYLSTG